MANFLVLALFLVHQTGGGQSLSGLGVVAFKDSTVIAASRVEVVGDLVLVADRQGNLYSIRKDLVDFDRSTRLTEAFRRRRSQKISSSRQGIPVEIVRAGVAGDQPARRERSSQSKPATPSVTGLEKERIDLTGKLNRIRLEGIRVTETTGRDGNRKIKVEMSKRALAEEKRLMKRIADIEATVERIRHAR